MRKLYQPSTLFLWENSSSQRTDNTNQLCLTHFHKIGMACTSPGAPLLLKTLQLCEDGKRPSEWRRPQPGLQGLTHSQYSVHCIKERSPTMVPRKRTFSASLPGIPKWKIKDNVTGSYANSATLRGTWTDRWWKWVQLSGAVAQCPPPVIVNMWGG